MTSLSRLLIHRHACPAQRSIAGCRFVPSVFSGECWWVQIVSYQTEQSGSSSGSVNRNVVSTICREGEQSWLHGLVCHSVVLSGPERSRSVAGVSETVAKVSKTVARASKSRQEQARVLLEQGFLTEPQLSVWPSNWAGSGPSRFIKCKANARINFDVCVNTCGGADKGVGAKGLLWLVGH